MVDSLQSLATDDTSRLAEKLGIELLLHKNWPLRHKVAYRTLHARLENMVQGFYIANDPSSPVRHNLRIRYFKSTIGLGRDQNGKNHWIEIAYCHGQVAGIVQLNVAFLLKVKLNHASVNTGPQWTKL